MFYTNQFLFSSIKEALRFAGIPRYIWGSRKIKNDSSKTIYYLNEDGWFWSIQIARLYNGGYMHPIHSRTIFYRKGKQEIASKT